MYNNQNNMNNEYTNQNTQNYYNPDETDNKFTREAYSNAIDGKIADFHKKRNRKARIKKFFKTIIILAILSFICVKGYNFITKSDYLENMTNNIKKNSLVDDATSMINAVRNEVTISGSASNVCYSLNTINTFVKRKLVNSPFKEHYSASSYIKATIDSSGNYTYSICLVDLAGNGINLTNEKDISKDKVKLNDAKCILPRGCF